jgi:hypothetical protein
MIDKDTLDKTDYIDWQDRLHGITYQKKNCPFMSVVLLEKQLNYHLEKAKRVSSPLQRIHSNIYGPINVRARHVVNYCITFIETFTQFGHVYLISHKSEALNCFIQYNNLVENKLSTKIKALITDQVHEYLSEQFKNVCDEKGIARQLIIPYTPQQNGVVEKRNKTLFDMVRSMMANANLSISF